MRQCGWVWLVDWTRPLEWNTHQFSSLYTFHRTIAFSFSLIWDLNKISQFSQCYGLKLISLQLILTFHPTATPSPALSVLFFFLFPHSQLRNDRQKSWSFLYMLRATGTTFISPQLGRLFDQTLVCTCDWVYWLTLAKHFLYIIGFVKRKEEQRGKERNGRGRKVKKIETVIEKSRNK